jgi:DNA replication and repair protein RecF
LNITRLYINNFRNYRKESLVFSEAVNLFIGNNAQGKTNILEALHILSTSKSFRTHKDDELIMAGEDSARIEATAQIMNNSRNFQIRYPRAQKKILNLNGKKIVKLSEFLGAINISVLSPDDIFIIRGDSSFRRRFLDIILCQIDKVYLDDLIRFQKTLKNKNFLLKAIKAGKEKYSALEPWNLQIAKYSVNIVNKRNKLAQYIDKNANIIHNILSNSMENLSLVYQDSVFNGQEIDFDGYEKALLNKQKRVQADELARGIALVGPHRDELALAINGMNIKQFGSQGQQRSVAISLRLAETEFIRSEKGEYPILLIDDIFAELDDPRKEYLMKLLRKDTQIFLTGTRISEFSSLVPQAKIFRIEKGKVLEQSDETTTS